MNSIETWKVIPGFDGTYFASNTGKVKSIDRSYISKDNKRCFRKGSILKPTRDRGGYLYVTLCFSGGKKTMKLHRLIALSFCKGFEEGLNVHHINGIRDDNRAENLQWVTKADNNRERYERGFYNAIGSKAHASKLKEEYINIIFSLYNSGVSQPVIAKAFNVTQATISNIITNKTYVKSIDVNTLEINPYE